MKAVTGPARISIEDIPPMTHDEEGRQNGERREEEEGRKQEIRSDRSLDCQDPHSSLTLMHINQSNQGHHQHQMSDLVFYRSPVSTFLSATLNDTREFQLDSSLGFGIPGPNDMYIRTIEPSQLHRPLALPVTLHGTSAPLEHNKSSPVVNRAISGPLMFVHGTSSLLPPVKVNDLVWVARR